LELEKTYINNKIKRLQAKNKPNMSFFGLTALGPQDAFVESRRGASFLYVFSEEDWKGINEMSKALLRVILI
jgi:hypothetical protein